MSHLLLFRNPTITDISLITGTVMKEERMLELGAFLPRCRQCGSKDQFSFCK